MAATRRRSLLASTSLLITLLIGCGGGGDVSVPTEVAPSASWESAQSVALDSAKHRPGRDPDARLRIGRGETLLIGTSARTILQVQPRNGRLLASLQVDDVPRHLAADDVNIYFGGNILGRYEIASGALFAFAFSDGVTAAVAMAIAPSGTLFASNAYLFPPDTTCATCSSVIAYPDPNGVDPQRRFLYLYGYVRDRGTGGGRLAGQQIGFTADGKLLVASFGREGIYVSNTPLTETCCGYREVDFTPLVLDATNTTIRFVRVGLDRLFVLKSGGSIDEFDLVSGAFRTHFVEHGLDDPIEMAVSDNGSIYVLERSGVVKRFSAEGKATASFTTPASAGQPLSITFCCKPTNRRESRD